MAQYSLEDARFTAIFVRVKIGGKTLYKRAPYELVRFNVDEYPEAELEVMPIGHGIEPKGKLYEKIWKVDELPNKKKVSFGG